MGHALEMGWQGREFALNVVFSLVLHFFVFTGVFLTPSLYTQRFHVPVTYEVKLVELPGARRVTRSGKRLPVVRRRSPSASPPVTRSTAPPETKASRAEPKARPVPPEALTIPDKPDIARGLPSTPEPAVNPKSAAGGPQIESLTPPQPIAQAPVPVKAPAPPLNGGTPGVVSESSVSTDRPDPSLSYYLAAIQAKVSSRWIEPSLALTPGEVERVTLGFTVLRPGVVRDIHVLAPSGNVFLDQSALRAVQEAVPLPPFPPLFPEEKLLVRFHFEMRGQ